MQQDNLESKINEFLIEIKKIIPSNFIIERKGLNIFHNIEYNIKNKFLFHEIGKLYYNLFIDNNIDTVYFIYKSFKEKGDDENGKTTAKLQ
jgi:hypothetical protein